MSTTPNVVPAAKVLAYANGSYGRKYDTQVMSTIEVGGLLYSQATVDTLQARIAELEKDAAFGRVAMRFVDRAGDVHPGIDDAETICAEFSAAMHLAMEKMEVTK